MLLFFLVVSDGSETDAWINLRSNLSMDLKQEKSVVTFVQAERSSCVLGFCPRYLYVFTLKCIL